MLEAQKTIEERKQEIIDQLEVLRAYIGEGVPTEIVHSNTRFKVRRGWFQSILFDMDWLLSRDGRDLISDQFYQELSEDFSKLEQISEQLEGRLTTQEDIDLGDSMIDKMTTELKDKFAGSIP